MNVRRRSGTAQKSPHQCAVLPDERDEHPGTAGGAPGVTPCNVSARSESYDRYSCQPYGNRSGAKGGSSMEDPLSRALLEASRGPDEELHPDVSRHRTDHAPPLGDVLESLREQLVEAMALPFFDAGSTVEMTPVTKVALTETGAATIVARKSDPAYEATVSVEVRCDHGTARNRGPDEDRYEVRPRAYLRHDDRGRRAEREVAVVVREIEGRLKLDTEYLRDEMASMIRSIEKGF
jgi:hypothetical protein